MTRILVATDGSAVSTEALHRFAHVLNPLDTQLYVLTVVFPPPNPASARQTAEYYEEAMSHAQHAIDGAMHEFTLGGFAAYGLTRVGLPGPTIVQAATDLKADFIVLGAHGHEGLEALVNESVSAYVFQHAECGVMVYPYRTTPVAV